MLDTAWEYLAALRRQLAPLPLPTANCTGKTVVVTGANTGLGREAARHFARLGCARVVLACRDVAKGEAARADIAASLLRPEDAQGGQRTPPTRLDVWPLDQGSFASVRAFAGRAGAELRRLDHVVLNAAVFPAPGGGGPVRVRESYEESVTVNVLAPFLLALLLLPTLRRGRPDTDDDVVSLCFVASAAHHYATFPQRRAPRVFDELRAGGDMTHRYADTKLLLVLLARALASALAPTLTTPSSTPPHRPFIVVNTVDPGLCTTEILRHVTGPLAWALGASMAALARSAEAGARTLVWAALAGRPAHGRYLQDAARPAPESLYVRGPDGAAAQARVWAELLAILDAAVPGVAANLEA